MTFGKIPMFMRGGIYDKPDNYMPDVQILKFANKSDNPNPEYAHSGDSGFDLRAYITESDENAKLDKKEGKYTITLKSLERKLIHTGLYFNIPENCEIQVRPRSGMALKHGLSVLNTPGTVDSNYVKLSLISDKRNKPGLRICHHRTGIYHGLRHSKDA